MAYFANGTEGDVLDNQCHKCLHAMSDTVTCPVVQMQMEYNYTQLNAGNEDLRAAMDMLIDEHGECRMRQAMIEAKVDFSAAYQMDLLEV